VSPDDDIQDDEPAIIFGMTLPVAETVALAILTNPAASDKAREFANDLHELTVGRQGGVN